METDPNAACELLVGLGDVNVLGVDDAVDEPIRIHVETRRLRPDCEQCETSAVVKDRPLVELVDLPAFGRPARLMWRKHRWACPDTTCPTKTWTEQEPRIAAARLALTDRAGRWVTFQVGKHGRTVNEVAEDLGCDWHTVNDAVIAYGTELVDDDGRIGDVTALGLDETLFCRVGRWRRQAWSTQIVDVAEGRLLDVVEGRTGARPAAWLAARGEPWCSQIKWATLDLSGPYRSVFDTMLPAAVQVADPLGVRLRIVDVDGRRAFTPDVTPSGVSQASAEASVDEDIRRELFFKDEDEDEHEWPLQTMTVLEGVGLSYLPPPSQR